MKKKQITIPIFLPHKGCPGRCIFCNQHKSSGSEKNPSNDSTNETIKKIEKYLSFISPDIEIIEIAFFGGNFTGLAISEQKKYLSIAQEYKTQKKIHAIRISTRPDHIYEKSLLFLKEYGVDWIEIGIQSFSDDVLKKSERGHTTDDVFKAVRLITESGFRFVIQLMAGLPGDNSTLSINSARIAASLKPHGVRLFPTVILKNTKLEKMYKNNQYVPLTMEDAIETIKDMYSIFQTSGIQVTRIGLNPVDNAPENIIAGPYHPAFGHMVKSRFQREIMEKKLKSFISNKSANRVLITIPQKEKEQYLGYKKNNFLYLQEKYFDLILDFQIQKGTEIPSVIIEKS